jgi:hypothetical protein
MGVTCAPPKAALLLPNEFLELEIETYALIHLLN